MSSSSSSSSYPTLDTGNIIEESLKITDTAEPKGIGNYTADDHLKAQKETINPLISNLQNEALQKTFLGSVLEQFPPTKPRKRGRPKKDSSNSAGGGGGGIGAALGSSGENLPGSLKKSADKNPSSQQQPVFSNNQRRIKQIRAFVSLYPRLSSIIPPIQNLHLYSTEDLESMWGLLKEEASNCSDDNMEYQAVLTAFYGIMNYFEPICAYLSLSYPQLPFVRNFSLLPQGSFSEFLKLSNEAGDGLDTELREISIELLGLFPKSLTMRFIYKLCYKVYDYNAFAHNNYLKKMNETLSQPSVKSKPIPKDIKEQIRKTTKTVSSSSNRL